MNSRPRQSLNFHTDKMSFGKYKGKTVEEILELKPSYIVWLVENDVADVKDEIYQEAQQLEYKDGNDWADFIDVYDWMD